MKTSIYVVAAFWCLLFAGCRHADRKENPPKPLASFALQTATSANPAGLQQNTEAGQTPYYQGLIEEFHSVLAQDPHNLAATIALGNAYFESGAWRGAIAQYEKALSMDPSNADVHADLGTAYRNVGMPDRALAEYRLALQYEPTHLNARYGMGIVYGFDYRKYDVAIHVWEELLRLAPNYPRADYIRSCIISFRSDPHHRGHSR